MTQKEFDALKNGDVIGRGARRFVIVAVHEGEGVWFSNVVYARPITGGVREVAVSLSDVLIEVKQ